MLIREPTAYASILEHSVKIQYKYPLYSRVLAETHRDFIARVTSKARIKYANYLRVREAKDAISLETNKDRDTLREAVA